MNSTCALIFLAFFVSIVIHQMYRPHLMASGQLLLVAVLDTTVAVVGGVAGNAVVQLFL